jgi:hypothetical protein
MRSAAQRRPALTQDAQDYLPHPDTLPDLFATTCVGNCLEPAIPTNTTLVFDKREPIQNGDFVVLIFRPEAVPPGENPGMVKRLYMGAGAPIGDQLSPDCEVIPLIMVEMLNPPKRLTFKASNVLAMIKCVGIAKNGGNGMAEIPREQPDWATIGERGAA